MSDSPPVTRGMRADESPGLGRPRVVSAAVVLLMALPVLGLLGAGLSFIALDIAAGTADRLAQGLAGRGVTSPQNLVDNAIAVMRHHQRDPRLHVPKPSRSPTG